MDLINVSKKTAEETMPAWVRRNPRLREAWHNSLSDRAEMIAADRSVDRYGEIVRVSRTIERRYDNC